MPAKLSKITNWQLKLRKAYKKAYKPHIGTWSEAQQIYKGYRDVLRTPLNPQGTKAIGKLIENPEGCKQVVCVLKKINRPALAQFIEARRSVLNTEHKYKIAYETVIYYGKLVKKYENAPQGLAANAMLEEAVPYADGLEIKLKQAKRDLATLKHKVIAEKKDLKF